MPWIHNSIDAGPNEQDRGLSDGTKPGGKGRQRRVRERRKRRSGVRGQRPRLGKREVSDGMVMAGATCLGRQGRDTEKRV